MQDGKGRRTSFPFGRPTEADTPQTFSRQAQASPTRSLVAPSPTAQVRETTHLVHEESSASETLPTSPRDKTTRHERRARAGPSLPATHRRTLRTPLHNRACVAESERFADSNSYDSTEHPAPNGQSTTRYRSRTIPRSGSRRHARSQRRIRRLRRGGRE
jgi:hypothetical protein